MTPCLGGCGSLTSEGGRCFDCASQRVAEWKRSALTPSPVAETRSRTTTARLPAGPQGALL